MQDEKIATASTSAYI